MRKPTCYLMIGLPGAGKTTKATEIAKKYKAHRFSPDDYILENYGNELDEIERDALRDPVEKLLWDQAIDFLKNKENVVVDFGMWAIEERKYFREAAEVIGAEVKFVYMEIDFPTAWERVSNRPESQSGTLKMTKELLEDCFSSFQPIQDQEKQFLFELETK